MIRFVGDLLGTRVVYASATDVSGKRGGDL